MHSPLPLTETPGSRRAEGQLKALGISVTVDLSCSWTAAALIKYCKSKSRAREVYGADRAWKASSMLVAIFNGNLLLKGILFYCLLLQCPCHAELETVQIS